MAEKDPAESGKRLHVTTLLVASRRALDNALAELGFAEDDDRVVEHDGRLAFLTCSHEEDSDDLFALITELSARGESWELQSRIDTEPGRAIYHSLARYRPVEAIDAAVEEEQEPESPETPDLRRRNRRRAASTQAHLETDPAGRRVCHDPSRPRWTRHRAGVAPRLPPTAGRRDGRGRSHLARRYPRNPTQCHARRGDEATGLSSDRSGHLLADSPSRSRYAAELDRTFTRSDA